MFLLRILFHSVSLMMPCNLLGSFLELKLHVKKLFCLNLIVYLFLENMLVIRCE